MGKPRDFGSALDFARFGSVKAWSKVNGFLEDGDEASVEPPAPILLLVVRLVVVEEVVVVVKDEEVVDGVVVEDEDEDDEYGSGEFGVEGDDE
jgi:hypothetical protein